jgi:radical SAM superfamily enzyme YgiQ (UPF0313 family)
MEAGREKQGAREYVKMDCPVRYGRYLEIETDDYLYHLNLNGEMKHVQGRGEKWTDPAEWLTRTPGNDWVYYATGGYQGVFDLFGEYYVPIPDYPTNHIIRKNPFSEPAVRAAIESVDRLGGKGSTELAGRGREFHDIIGGVVSVLPPDSRHVNYEVLPVNVADGCLYNCAFCAIKTGDTFKVRDRGDVDRQIEGLCEHLGADIVNYNSVFLGGHDGLLAGGELIGHAAGRAYEAFGLERSYMQGANLFLFGSVHSLLKAEEGLFEAVNRLPYSTWINIGLESADAQTLKELGKPLAVDDVVRAFARMVEINRSYEKIEVTANFVISMELPQRHTDSIIELTRRVLPRPYSKGAVYLSPLMTETRERRAGWREWLKKIHDMQIACRLPCYLYLIQRL